MNSCIKNFDQTATLGPEINATSTNRVRGIGKKRLYFPDLLDLAGLLNLADLPDLVDLPDLMDLADLQDLLDLPDLPDLLDLPDLSYP